MYIKYKHQADLRFLQKKHRKDGLLEAICRWSAPAWCQWRSCQ